MGLRNAVSLAPASPHPSRPAQDPCHWEGDNKSYCCGFQADAHRCPDHRSVHRTAENPHEAPGGIIAERLRLDRQQRESESEEKQDGYWCQRWPREPRPTSRSHSACRPFDPRSSTCSRRRERSLAEIRTCSRPANLPCNGGFSYPFGVMSAEAFRSIRYNYWLGRDWRALSVDCPKPGAVAAPNDVLVGHLTWAEAGQSKIHPDRRLALRRSPDAAAPACFAWCWCLP